MNIIDRIFNEMGITDSKTESNKAWGELEIRDQDAAFSDEADKFTEVGRVCVILGENVIADTQGICNSYAAISNAKVDIFENATNFCVTDKYDLAFILATQEDDINVIAKAVRELRNVGCHGIVTVFDVDVPKDDADYGDLVYLLKDDIACEGRLIKQGSTAEEALLDIVGCVYNVFAGYDKRSSRALTDRIDFYPIKEFQPCYRIDILKCEGNFVQQSIPSIAASLCNSLEVYRERVCRLYIHILGNCSLSLDEVNAVSDEIVECVSENADIEYGMHIDDTKPNGDIEVIVVVGID